MKIEELGPGERDRYIAFIREHGELLRKNLKEAVAVANNYLLLSLGGALAAMLSLMGASAEIRNTPAAFRALIFFAIGLLLTGALAAASFEVGRLQFQQWLKDSDDFAGGITDHTVIFSSLNRIASRYGRIPTVFGYAAFLCLIVGFWIALEGLAPRLVATHKLPVARQTTSRPAPATANLPRSR